MYIPTSERCYGEPVVQDMFLDKHIPRVKKVVIILSGGLDSTILMRFAVEKWGPKNVVALSFNYGQRQFVELQMAKMSTKLYDVEHHVLDLGILGQIGKGFSANVDEDIKMPTIKEVLGDPRPKTYVPNRNMIMMSIAAAFAEVNGAELILMGLQIHDEYNYHDTTQRFVDKVNDVLAENRISKIRILTPFSGLSKIDELKMLKELDGDLKLTAFTMTCYNPEVIRSPINTYRACGKCPSCSERINAFVKIGEPDPLPYMIDINWEKLINGSST